MIWLLALASVGAYGAGVTDMPYSIPFIWFWAFAVVRIADRAHMRGPQCP